MSEYSEKTPLQKANYANATKSILVNNLINKGFSITSDDSFRDVATKVGTNSTIVNTSDANATINDIVSNKTAYVNGQKLTGTAQIASDTDIPITVIPEFLVNIDDGQYYISVSDSVYIPNIFGEDVPYSGIRLSDAIIVCKPNQWTKLYAGSYSGNQKTVTFSYDSTSNKIIGTNPTSNGYYYEFTLKDNNWQDVYMIFQPTLTSNYLERLKSYRWWLTNQSNTPGQIFEYDISAYDFYSYDTFTNADSTFTDYKGVSYGGTGTLSTKNTVDAPNLAETYRFRYK